MCRPASSLDERESRRHGGLAGLAAGELRGWLGASPRRDYEPFESRAASLASFFMSASLLVL